MRGAGDLNGRPPFWIARIAPQAPRWRYRHRACSNASSRGWCSRRCCLRQKGRWAEAKGRGAGRLSQKRGAPRRFHKRKRRSTTMANTILGLFDNPLDARRAMEQIRDSDLKTHDVSIISRATESGAPISSVDDVSAGEGAAVGAVWGGLVGLAALLIPGVGPFIALGALGAALTGAVTGAVVGGISAALIDFGDIPEAEAREYEAKVHAGQTLVAVKVDDENTAEARRMLVAAGANSIYDNQTDITSGQTANVVSSGPGQ